MATMTKRNIKLFARLLTGLFLMGLGGLFMGLAEINARYEKNHRVLEVLSRQVVKLQYRADTNERKLEQFAFMEYKVSAFTRRFPTFSSVLDTVYRKSRQYGFEPNLVLGIVKVESGYQPSAVSNRGAYGLMQINLAVWRKALGIEDHRIFDLDYNVDLGCKILKHYYEESNGNMKRALHLYNNGYLYNNTGYVDKVDSAALALKTRKIKYTPSYPAGVLGE